MSGFRRSRTRRGGASRDRNSWIRSGSRICRWVFRRAETSTAAKTSWRAINLLRRIRPHSRNVECLTTPREIGNAEEGRPTACEKRRTAYQFIFRALAAPHKAPDGPCSPRSVCRILEGMEIGQIAQLSQKGMAFSTDSRFAFIPRADTDTLCVQASGL